MRQLFTLVILSGLLFNGCTEKTSGSDGPGRAEILFLGHDSEHHNSDRYAPWLATAVFTSGINLTYTTDPGDLNRENLAKFDGLVIYANHDSLPASQEKALKEFVEGGKGLIALHSASGCFKNSEWYIEAVGGQFKSHGTGTFTAGITNRSHPVTRHLAEFETWDETYVHQRLDSGNIVLMERVADGHSEPYTWVREQGKGRVFYTAFGHNDSTWTDHGFLELVKSGILWAIGDEVREKVAALNIPDVSIYDSTISNFDQRHYVPKMQQALTPEESMKLIQVPVDFEVKLFAAEPDITNPIAMAWDEKGRLWIVESVDYPNTFAETDGATNDRIKICEDTDKDGRADKFTVFADSLNIPTSIVFAGGGVIVSMAPHFVFLKDTDGDDKADVRKNIITGWGKNDTHSGPSNLQYGFDNKIWGVVGFSGFEGTVNGESMRFGSGVYRFSPDGKDFEYLATTSNNTWGLGFSEDNNVFISTANNTHSAFYSMPARYALRNLPEPTVKTPALHSIDPVQKIDGHYEVHAMTPNLRQVDVLGGFTAAAGHHMYTARRFPREYWNRVAFVNEPTVRLVHNAIITPDGAGFTEKDGWNLMASSDEWFGPVYTEVGPDGAVWVADWYNFIIQHNKFVESQAPSHLVLPFEEQPLGQGNAFISPMRDINHGRIYRVVYKDAGPYEPVELSGEDMPGLLAALAHDNMFWRMTAQRLLVGTQNREAIPGLYELINNREVDQIGLNSPAVHALWTLHGLGALDGSDPASLKVAVKALSHPAAGVRKAAVSVLPKNQEGMQAIREGGLVNDPDLHVRMAALLALATCPPSEEVGRSVFEATLKPENTEDPWLRKGLVAAAIAHKGGFVKAAADGRQQSVFGKRVLAALNREIYDLPRRGTLPFPVNVLGKEIIVKVSIAKKEEDLQGVIMAHGGNQGGYGLYIRDGKLHMVVKQNGKTYQAVSTRPLPEKFDVEMKLTSGGEMTLAVNGRQVGKGKAPSLFIRPLVSSIRMKYDFDNEDKMGDYEGNFPLNGELFDASLELKVPEGTAGTPVLTTAHAGSAQAPDPAIRHIVVVAEKMQFDQKSFTVKAGQKVRIELDNRDGMQHNLLIIQPGMLEKVGKAADALARNPGKTQKQYVPDMAAVLHATRLLNPGEIVTLTFTAPEKPGDYPFVCTFPGHWRMMNGIMKVVRESSPVQIP